MLDRFKNLFSPPNKEEETMAATSQKQQQKTHMGKTFTETAPVEQLSATTECESSSRCEESIREKAYLLWEAAGYPEGDGVDFWLQAEQALSESDA